MIRYSSLHRFDIVEVTWVDSEQQQEWTEYASYDHKKPPHIRSVGYFYDQGEDYVIIFQSMDETVITRGSGIFDSLLNIPKCSIVNVKIIKRLKK